MVSYIQLSWWSELITKNQDLTLALLTCSLIALATWLLHKSRKTTLSLPPGPRGLPVVGYLPFLGHNLHIEFTKMAQTYGPIFKLKLGSKTHIVVSSSDLAKVVVREQDEIFANRDPPIVAMVLTNGGQNITWSDNNSHWRNLRKLFVTEIMTKKNLEASHSFRRSEVRKTIKHIYETKGTTVDVGNLSFLTSLSVVTSLLWGKSLGEDEKSRNLGNEIRDVIFNIMELMGTANVSDFFPVLSKLDLQGIQRQMKLQSKKLNGILDGVIDERIAIKPQAGEDQVGKKDLLQILLELKEENKFNLAQIKALLLDVIAGGTDTTTTMVEWVMAELLQNPKVMQKVKDELNEVVGPNCIVEEFHLPKLEYIDAVVKETFRLHTPLPLLITRCPTQSCTVGGYTVPKGSHVYLNVWAIHRDPQYWEDPLEFNPNRFLSTAGDGESKFDYMGYNTIYMPFGSGRRRCPGVLLGDRMLLYILASMLHSFDWSLPVGKENDLSGKFGLMLKRGEPLMAIPSQRLTDKTLYM